MNCAKSIVPSASARARKIARNSGEAARAEGVVDEPIYKVKRMHTVGGMFKRILILAAGVTLGVALSLTAARVAVAWNLFPSRDLSRNSGYVRDVMQLVNENYVDGKAAAYDRLARNAIHGMVESLDPHSEFLEAKDNKEFEEDLTGEFGGIGIEVETRQGKAIVIAPIAGTPSDRAGIQRGDEIVAIDGKPGDYLNSSDGIVDLRRGNGWDAAREVIETEARGGFLAEAESFHDLVRFGWEGWTGATPDESIDIAMTLDAIAASSRQGVPVEVGR